MNGICLQGFVELGLNVMDDVPNMDILSGR